MRTFGLILYFLFACHGFSDDAEQIVDSCDGKSEQESQEAIIEYGESLFSKFSKRLTKRVSKKKSLSAFEAFYNRESNPRFWIVNNDLSNNAENEPKVNPAILEHTFFNALFFPPDKEDIASVA
ncbi:hypothetical protein N9L92_01415 [Saprospiraceae bacterium]|nr:hypothetical protein [Saprospiraceae bacterium]